MIHEFAELLRRQQLLAGLSQEPLAERAQVSVRAISDLERGQRRAPHPATIARLADALNLDAESRQALLLAATASSARGAPDDNKTAVSPTASEVAEVEPEPAAPAGPAVETLGCVSRPGTALGHRAGD